MESPSRSNLSRNFVLLRTWLYHWRLYHCGIVVYQLERSACNVESTGSSLVRDMGELYDAPMRELCNAPYQS